MPRNLANKQERSLELVFILAQMTVIQNALDNCTKSIKGINKIHIPSLETHVRVLYWIWTDGKQRRIDTGKS